MYVCTKPYIRKVLEGFGLFQSRGMQLNMEITRDRNTSWFIKPHILYHN